MEAKAKPSYLGLLNAIALGEGRAHEYLSCWAAKTPDADVKKVLQTVAIREGEHSHAFTKRLCELGYGVQDRPDSSFAKSMEIANADCSDLEKFEAFGYGKREERDLFAGVFDDQTIDIRTGELLGRDTAEERDSARLLRSCYDQLKAAADGSRVDASEDRLAELERKVDRLLAAMAPPKGTTARSSLKNGRRTTSKA
jgi:rubrerythrin